MVDQFATLILNSCSLDHLNQGWSQLNTCVRWELHAQAFYVTGHHCKNRNSGHSICEPQSPPPSTYFLVMITECVCYQDKVSPRFHIPGIHASPCKTIHILGGGGPRTTSRKLIHQTTACRWYIRAASIIYYHYLMAQLLQYPWTTDAVSSLLKMFWLLNHYFWY